MIRRIQSPGIVSTVYSRIFRHSLSNWKVSGCIPVIRHLSLLWLYVRYCIRHIQNSDTFTTLFFRYMPAYSFMFRAIKIFTHIETSRHIQSYSGIFSTLCNSRVCTTLSCHILSPNTFKLVAYFKPCETLTRHIQNSAMGHYAAIFWHIKTLCNTCICRNLGHSESWNIQNLHIIVSRSIFRALSFLRRFSNIQNWHI